MTGVSLHVDAKLLQVWPIERMRKNESSMDILYILYILYLV